MSTQLTAGTAPALIFNQDYFGSEAPGARNAQNEYEWVPFNLVIIGVYYNADILDEAGVQAPIATYGDLLEAGEKIKAAGYIPFAMDNGWLGQGWTYGIINTMLMSRYADQLNVFAADGSPGQARQVSGKSIAKAILTDEISPTKTPEVAETLRLLKNFFDQCATPNWSGISGGAAFIGAEDFLGGKAAMTFGTNFAAENLADVTWTYSTMPFPTVAESDSPLSTGMPAQFGAQAGGTSYMIPATTKDDELEAAIKFLQFATSPEGGQPWLDQSGGIPATADGKAAPGLDHRRQGDRQGRRLHRGLGPVALRPVRPGRC